MIQARFKGLPNQDIRELADRSGVCLWEIGAYLGRSDMWMTRKMRVQLTEKDRETFEGIITTIAARKHAEEDLS